MESWLVFGAEVFLLKISPVQSGCRRPGFPLFILESVRVFSYSLLFFFQLPSRCKCIPSELQRQEQMSLSTHRQDLGLCGVPGERPSTQMPLRVHLPAAPSWPSLLSQPPVPWKHRRSWAGLLFIVRLEWVNLLTFLPRVGPHPGPHEDSLFYFILFSCGNMRSALSSYQVYNTCCFL